VADYDDHPHARTRTSVDFGFVLRNGGWESVNESGRKEGEKKETQSGRRMAEKVEAGGYPELQPMYDSRTSTSLIKLW
jgi:hypothetical protein